MFQVQIGTLDNKDDVDVFREWVVNEYAQDLRERPSMHVYLKKLSSDVLQLVDRIRYSKKIMDGICKQFPDQCDVTPLPSTDELYISHYNKDNGGDQGLFDKHYDGSFRMFGDSTVVRALIYINSDDDYEVEFMDSRLRHNFKTYEFGLLDFHRELHEVHGSYNESDSPRILLKINYLVCPKCTTVYKRIVVTMNLVVFYVVKACMEYSKSPKTVLQKLVGFLCNLFRVLNMVHPLLSLVFLIGVVVFVAAVLRWIRHSINSADVWESTRSTSRDPMRTRRMRTPV